MNKVLLGAISLALIGGVAVVAWKGSRDDPTAPAATDPADQVAVPQLGSAAQMGKIAFDANCAGCHGENAAGSDQGPTFLHKVYRPSHHADFAFLLAAKNGVRAHHWRFGNMPPVPGVTDKQVEWIVQYVRALQRANGID